MCESRSPLHQAPLLFGCDGKRETGNILNSLWSYPQNTKFWSLLASRLVLCFILKSANISLTEEEGSSKQYFNCVNPLIFHGTFPCSITYEESVEIECDHKFPAFPSHSVTPTFQPAFFVPETEQNPIINLNHHKNQFHGEAKPDPPSCCKQSIPV